MSSSIRLGYSSISSSFSGLTFWVACVTSVLIYSPLFHVVVSNSVKENRQLALTASCSSSSLSLVHSHSSSVGSTVPVTISRLCNTHKTGTGAWKKTTFFKYMETDMSETDTFQKVNCKYSCWNPHQRHTLTLFYSLKHTHTYIQRDRCGGDYSCHHSVKAPIWALVTRSGNSHDWQWNSWLLVDAVFILAPKT